MERLTVFLAFGGVLFAGYLSGVKFFSETCAFGESCPYFLGYPACYYGLVMYCLLLILAFARVIGVMDRERANTRILAIAGLGILFSGYFTALELPVLFAEGLGAYVTGLPTCAMGLIMYIIIFAIALRLRARPII